MVCDNRMERIIVVILVVVGLVINVCRTEDEMNKNSMSSNIELSVTIHDVDKLITDLGVNADLTGKIKKLEKKILSQVQNLDVELSKFGDECKKENSNLEAKFTEELKEFDHNLDNFAAQIDTISGMIAKLNGA
ncbi:uncharacterized protein LOC141898269 [Tubulanus polymorphus]|uniref:uncharacterized protein LOC141898269 n=1 Tax=Tubulanus polymorphus TaxID=672921 RepID=UPI003DA1E668